MLYTGPVWRRRRRWCCVDTDDVLSAVWQGAPVWPQRKIISDWQHFISDQSRLTGPALPASMVHSSHWSRNVRALLSLVQSFQLSYAIKNQLKASKILCLSHKERWLQCTERINYIGAANRFLPCMEATLARQRQTKGNIITFNNDDLKEKVSWINTILEELTICNNLFSLLASCFSTL